MYLLSSAEALDKFIENPRRYIMPPQPVPPCKMIVLGAPLSGKTTLSRKLAARYNSKVGETHEHDSISILNKPG